MRVDSEAPIFTRMTVSVRRTPVLLLCIAVLTGCGLSRSAPGAVLSDGSPPSGVTDANNAEILYADLALAKSGHPDVTACAQMVKMDHEAVNTAPVALVTWLKVTPADNVTAYDLRDDAGTWRLTLGEAPLTFTEIRVRADPACCR